MPKPLNHPVPSGPDRTAVAPREPTFEEEARAAAEGITEASEYLKANGLQDDGWMDAMVEAHRVLSEIVESKPAPPSVVEALGHCVRVIKEHLRPFGPGEEDDAQPLEPYFRGALEKAEEALAMPAFNPYHDQVKKHQAKYRPKESQALKEGGYLEDHVRELADQLEEAVENYRQAYLEKNPVPKGADTLETARHLNHAKLIAEEVMTREYLPWDEEQLAEIGPSGGYED